MKNIEITFFSIITFFAIIFASCDKSDITTLNSLESDKLFIVGDTILSFSSESEMFKQGNVLLNMTSSSRQKWYENNNNFLCQNDFLWIVAEEIDKATSIQEALKIHKKYKNLLNFKYNTNNNDLSPYFISDDPIINLVCNKNGNVVIDGQIKNYNVRTKSESDSYTVVSSVYNETNKRKFWAEFLHHQGTPEIYLRLSAHKRILGIAWNICKEEYYLDIEMLNNIGSGKEQWSALSNFANSVYDKSAEENYVQLKSPFKTNNISSGTVYLWGLWQNINGKLSSVRMNVWSDGVGEINKKELILIK